MPFLIILLLAVAIAVGVLNVFAFVMRIILFFRYHKLNHTSCATDLDALTITRKVLDANGLEDVGVEKGGFFRMLFFGNHYSVRKKKIYLRGNICNKNTSTAIGVALQKVGLAMQHRNKDKGFMAAYVLRILSLFSPFIFYGLVIVGLVIDFLIVSGGFNFQGSATLICLIIGLVYYILVFFALLFTIKSNKKANKTAINMVEKANLLGDKDMADLIKLLNMYVTIEIIDFVISILKIVEQVIKITLNVSNKKSA